VEFEKKEVHRWKIRIERERERERERDLDLEQSFPHSPQKEPALPPPWFHTSTFYGR
jgi:hypothetical protein